MKDVIVIIKNKQLSPEGEVDNVELVTSGKMTTKSDSIYIIYKEAKDQGKGITTTIKVELDAVTINRMGGNELKQYFKEGVEYHCIYQTLYGNILLDINTHSVDIDLTAFGGSIKLKYELFTDGTKLSDNSLQIDIKLLDS